MIPSRRRVNHVLICGNTGKELCRGCDKTCVNVKKTTFAKAKFYIIERDGRCLRCGKIEGLTIDHVVPLSKGGTNDDDNLQTLCNECNQWKKDFIVDFR